MANGWLTPWSIFWSALNKYIIKNEDGLGPSWEFPNATGVVCLSTSPGVLPTAEALTVDAVGENITPTLGVDLIKVVTVSGAGGLADDLKIITAPAAWVNKMILIQMAGAGTITLVASASIVMPNNFALDSVSDRILLLCTAANTWIQLFRISNA